MNKNLITTFFIAITVFIGLFIFLNYSLAADMVDPPFGIEKCTGDGDRSCEERFGSRLPACLKKVLGNENYYYYCGKSISSQTTQVQEFKSPTGTATFASLICSVTNFISQTVLPPVAVLMMLVVGFLFLTSGGAPQRAGTAQKALLFTAAGVALLALAPGIVVLIGDLFGSVVVSSSSSCNTITTGTIVGALLKTVNWFSWFVAVVAVAMGLYSGFLYITARDNPQQIQQAAKVLSFVIIGIAVSILAFSIVTITKQLMGL